MTQAIPVSREDHGSHGGYYADVPGAAKRAELTWTAHDGVRIADHTFVPPEARGLGIAGALVQALIDDARTHGFRVVPQCSYVEAAFRRHKEWAELRA